MKKRILGILICAFAMLIFIGIDSPNIQAEGLDEDIISIDMNNPESETIISEVMTFEQVVAQYAMENNVSKLRAENVILGINSISNSIGTKSLDLARVEAQSNTYRTISNQFTVTNSYKPSIRFYAQTSESGNFHGILKILNVQLSRVYNGTSYAFGGEIYTHLQNGSTIYYSIDGDFYHNGTTTGTGGVEIGIGGTATISFGLSYESNHYKAVDLYKTFTW